MLVDDGDPAGLGPALVWAERHGVGDLAILVDDGIRSSAARASDGGIGDEAVGRPPASGVIARRAAEWAEGPTVWRVEGRTLVAVAPAAAPSEPPLPPEALAYATVLRAHGADAVIEHGALFGEVIGLEVARVVPRADGWYLEVGVGRLDRDARAEMRPDEPDGEAIDEVVRVVRTWRRAGAPRHPANTLARERWLRAVVVARPSSVGASVLTPMAPPLARRGLRQGGSVPAVGSATDGAPLIVMCSTGVDVDLVPAAADARRLHAARHPADWRLVLVVPEGDDYPVTRSMAAALRHPAAVVTVPRHWAT